MTSVSSSSDPVSSDDGGDTGSIWRTVMARLESLILNLITSGQGSSSAAMPAKPGLANDTPRLA